MELTQAQQQKLRRLLPMNYTPRELAQELGLDTRALRKSLTAGAPFRRDKRGRIWIMGEEFREWYRENHKGNKHPMEANEAWCCRCRKPVPMINPEVCRTLAYTELLRAQCPECQATINRARRLTQ